MSDFEARWIAIQDQLSEISDAYSLLLESRDELLAAAKKLLAAIEPMAWETHLLLEVPALKAAIANAEKLP